MSTLAIIPVKAESQRLSGKNFLEVGGTTLVRRAWDLARQGIEIGLFDAVAISYDQWHARLVEIRDCQGALPSTLHQQPGERPPTTTLAVVQDLLAKSDTRKCDCSGSFHEVRWDLICLLVPTSPLRTLKHLVQSRLRLEGQDLVMSVAPFRESVAGAVAIEDGLVKLVADDPHQHVDAWKHEGTVIWARAQWFGAGPKHWYDAGRIAAYPMDRMESVDIDYEVDLVLARALDARSVGREIA